MSLPGNGIFVVRGEMSTLITAMRRSTRWNATAYGDEEKDGLIKLFMDLKQVLNRIEDLRLIDPNIFLAPFLEVIRTDETTGAVTSLALAAINKFLSYGLIDPTSPNLAVTVENIVDAVTHARFMGSDQSTDGVTLFRVVEVLHTLMRSPEGSALTNESVCEVMLSCFKICFEPRLNELLRRFAEQALKDMVLLLFMRLPQFSEDRSEAGVLKKFQMMAAAMEKDKKQRKKLSNGGAGGAAAKQSIRDERKLTSSASSSSVNTTNSVEELQPQTPHTLTVQHLKVAPLSTTPATPLGNILDMQGKITQTPTTSAAAETQEATISTPTTSSAVDLQQPQIQIAAATPEQHSQSNINAIEQQDLTPTASANNLEGSNEYINSMGVRFTQQNSLDGSEGMLPLVPYGLPCIQELFRFLILLCNPLDKQNTDTMMHMGLSLLTVAFEVGADNIGKYDTLLELVKDDLCRNLMSLMSSERLSIFAADLQLCFLLFESLRGHLKFQLEAYLKKLSEIIASDNPKTPYEVRELALDNLLQLCRIPGFVTELYINYDCDLYCTDMFESLTNLLSKYTLSATNAVYSTHIIAMDTLLCIIDNIESNCIAAKNSATTDNPVPVAHSNRHSRHNSGLEGIVIEAAPGVAQQHNDEPKVAIENISKFLNNSSRIRLASTQQPEAKAGQAVVSSSALTREQLAEVKRKKRVLTQGTELFNQRPDKGIQHLQENGILNQQLDPMEIALFLRENPGLDKKMIGEYISRKKNVDSKILMNFVESFDFAGLRVDQALRLYLETFRLPGEAPLIFLVLEHFADHWHKQNGEPFANTDAAFSLAYAIIMLNMDQHNSNAKRLNVPMIQEEFIKNLRGVNDGKDFDQDMLAAIYNAIKNEEIVMPAEQTGIVRENYLWKVLLRRGLTPDGVFNYVQDASYDLEIFNIIWGASLSALSFMFDKSNETGYQRTLTGFTKSAGIAAHYQQHEDFDAIVLTLCKFTTLLNSMQQEAQTTTSAQHNELMQAINFGLNPKAQAAMRTVFLLVHDYGDCLREGWKNILDIYLQVFKLKLLPKSLMEVEDFCEPNGKAQLILEKPSQKQEAGLFSSLYSYLSSESQREPTYEEQEFIKIGKKCIKDCQFEQMIQETKFVQLESLQELLKVVLSMLKAPNAHKSIGLPYAEDVVVFWMEFLVKIVIHNRDRMIPLWPAVRDQMYLLLLGSASCGYDYLLNRCIVAVLKLAIYLMRNEELCPIVLQSLKMLLMLKPAVLLRISKQISIGIYELLKTSAQNIHSEQDWQIIFTILECVGAGAIPPEFDDATLPVPNGCSAKSDGALSSEDDSGLPDRGYTSDSELSAKQQQQQLEQQALRQAAANTGSPYPHASPTAENWILVNKDTDLANMSRPQSPPVAPALSSLVYDCKLLEHAPFALFKCWDSLAFIVRNVAHITPYNFESCVRCIRTFVEACRDGGLRQRRKFEASVKAEAAANGQKKKSSTKRNAERDAGSQRKSAGASNGSEVDARNDVEAEDLAQRYETLSIQLLDLMYTLYTRTAQIFRWWAEEGCAVPQCSALWAQGWCPLLQGIARLAMDRRREVRTYAISCLQQRALLVHDLQTLSGAEWASCFQQVLFPLLNELLPDSSSIAYLDSLLLEESRIRTATIMSKVFLHHLTPLIELGSSFNELWLAILDYIERFMRVGSDMLSEQMQEILKNMLLVMHSVRVFHQSDGSLHQPLWELTWRRIGEFLPQLKDELFRDEGKPAEARQKMPASSHIASTLPAANVSTAVPRVAILPQPQPSQPAALQPSSAVTSPVSSPIESPRHSIILQPPAAQSLILGALPATTSMPVLVPPTTPATSPVHTRSPESEQQQQQHLVMPTLVQPIPLVAHAATAPALPDILSDTAAVGAAQTQQEQANDPGASQASFSIYFPESEGRQQSVNSYEEQQQQPGQQQQVTANESQQETAAAEQQQREYQKYYEQYQEYLKQQQQYQAYQQQQQLATSSTPAEAQQPVAPTLATSTYTVDTLNGNLLATTAPPPEAAPATTTKSPVNVPISHLLAGNQYPSLNRMPNAAIANSFAPVYVHNDMLLQQQQQQQAAGGADIYQEYVQNPYNLTLQQQPMLDVSAQQQQQQQQQQQSHLQGNSAANYFANNAPDSQQNMPPGAEILFGGP